jgi:hypothetical protein
MNANVRDPTRKENAENLGMASHAGACRRDVVSRCEAGTHLHVQLSR